jgi:TolB-like protein/Tfp pilus assembly protein PilF/DNA-binding winged helix-turn-helix (wHTH) protein
LPDSELTLFTLGGLELRRGADGPVALKSRKARALLAILSTQPGLRMSRARIASLLWADRAEAQARGSLRQALSELRRALGPEDADVVCPSAETVELDGTRIECDVLRFEALLGRGDRPALEEAVALHRGPFMEDFDLREDAFDEWRLQERRRLEARLLSSLASLASLCEADGDAEAALGHVDRAIEIAPLREEMHRKGMELCQRLERSTEALERYERLRSRLAAELNVEPQAESRDLYTAIRSSHEEGARGFAALQASDPAQAGVRDQQAGGKPSVAVLPFGNLSRDPEQEYFADGMTEDIITELSRFRGLFVIARNSTFVYKGRAVDTREIARELGVKYVLEGSVRGGVDRLRVSAQLIDAANRSHVWAERYDREPSDLFSLQDEIVRTLVAAVEPELDDAERRNATSASPERLDAWGAYHRGMWHVYRFTKEDTAQALAFFMKAIEAAPTHTPGWTGRSFAHFSNVFLGFVDDREAERRLCLEAARRAVELDSRDASAHWALGRAHSLELDYDRAIAELETAVELNTNHAQSWYQLGWVLVRAGRPQDALEPLVLAERLSPNDPLRFAFLIARAQAHFVLGEYSHAVALADRAVRLPHAHAQIEAIRVACLVMDGQIEAARKAMEAFRSAHPDFTQAFFAEAHGFARQEDLSRYLDAFERSGLPE